MGHDISAYSDGEEVAYLRRSAFSRLNKVIYVALDAETAYAGCSGNGDWLEFDMSSLKKARKMLQSPGEFVDIERERSFADDVLEMLLGGKMIPADDTSESITDIRPELKFVNDCIDALQASDDEKIEVQFC